MIALFLEAIEAKKEDLLYSNNNNKGNKSKHWNQIFNGLNVHDSYGVHKTTKGK